MDAIRWMLVVLMCGVSPMLAQGTPAPAFETASIHPMEPSAGCVSMLPPGGTHFSMSCLPLRQVIATAWGVDADDVQGGDASALGVYYDIRATTPGEKPWSFDEARLMLQKLLIDRFHLAAHASSRQQAGYGLYVAKGGLKLPAAKYDVEKDGVVANQPSHNYITETHVEGVQVKMPVIAFLLSRVLREPVADHTGVAGLFNVSLDFAPIRDPAQESPYPQFFDAVESTLGLQLKAEKVTIPTLIVDHVDSVPMAN